MMRPIKLTSQLTQKILSNIEQKLLQIKTTQKSIELKIDIPNFISKNIPKPTVRFTEEAYTKITDLVKNCTEEIAWHGVVERRDNLTFIIKDILVYPQYITGATVDADEKEYALWLDTLDDNTFNTMRMQGHSHVDMGVSPSGRDRDTFEKYIKLLKKPEDFYIFMIINKKENLFLEIYDLKTNSIYETQDIKTDIPETAESWALQEMKKYVKKKRQTYRGTTSYFKDNDEEEYDSYARYYKAHGLLQSDKHNR